MAEVMAWGSGLACPEGWELVSVAEWELLSGRPQSMSAAEEELSERRSQSASGRG